MMFRITTPVLATLLLVTPAYAQQVETELPGVMAELVELRIDGGVVRLGVRFLNSSNARVRSNPFHFSQFTLIAAKTRAKHFPIKAADGRYLAGPANDWDGGGRAWLDIPAKSSVIVWAAFDALPSETIVSAQIPFLLPFDDVPVASGPGKVFSNSATTTAVPAITGTLLSARRAEGQLRLRLRLQPSGTSVTDAPTFQYADVFVFDPVNKRKYPVAKDTDGTYLATPISDGSGGGRLILGVMPIKGLTLMSLTIVAPPDTVTKGDLIIPGFLPITGFDIVGAGGAPAGGVAATGRTVGFDAALKSLAATVSPEGIAITLPADVLFDSDKAMLRAASEQSLQQLLVILTDQPLSKVSVVGHTDTRGEAAHNKALSERRASAVAVWLTGHGIAASRVTTSGAGEARPVRTGSTDADHQANRRVEIMISAHGGIQTHDRGA